MKRKIISRSVPARGGNLAVYEWPADDDAAPVILAIHGITGSHRAWPYVADALPQFRIIAPDLRGRGRSNDLPPPYGMQQHAEDCAAGLDALKIDRALVIGHSMGAFVATTFAAKHPTRTEALLLVDGGLPLALPKLVRHPRRISRNAHKFAFCKLLRARLNEPPPLHRLLSTRPRDVDVTRRRRARSLFGKRHHGGRRAKNGTSLFRNRILGHAGRFVRAALEARDRRRRHDGNFA